MRREAVRTGYFWTKYRDVVLAYAIMAAILLLFISRQRDFFTKWGLQSVVNQVITLCVAAFAQTLVILTGGIDLSIGSLVGLCNAVVAMTMAPLIGGVGEPLGCIAAALLGVLVGAAGGGLNGQIVARTSIQPIIVTLATSSIFVGVAKYICPTPGGVVSRAFQKALAGRAFDVIPCSLLVLIAVILFWTVLRRTKLCQGIYAIGNNEYAAMVSSIDVARIKVMTYVLAGGMCGLCAVLLTAQTASGDPAGSLNMTINTVVSVTLGGALLTGGKGTYIGSIAGAVTISLILGLLIFFKISSFYQGAVQGCLLILVLVMRFAQNRAAARKLA